MGTIEQNQITQEIVTEKLAVNKVRFYFHWQSFENTFTHNNISFQIIMSPNPSNNSNVKQIANGSNMVNGNSSAHEIYDNVIVGGGPGGINLAMEFAVRGISYVLLERSSNFGGQFRHFPRCGELISLNKKHLPEQCSSWTYARRYDWHTLSTITEEESKNDPELLFTNWSDSLFPKAKDLAEYLEYVGKHPNWRVVDHSRFNCEVTCITSNDFNQFVIETATGETFLAKRVFMATGTSRPVVPNIRGILEHGIFYRDFDPNDTERYRNKRVVILGGGNSAFEVADSLKHLTGDMLILIRSTLKFARQTHNVHDVRTQTSVAYDLAQLKSLTAIAAERVTEIKRREDGRLLLKTSTPEPHWQTPVWRHRDLVADHVIVCCGFEYTVPDVFTTDRVRPQADPIGKFCLLTPTWESINVQNLYFVGGSMRVNDYDASSGFIHGFRYNITALASVIAERHYNQPLKPLFECIVDPERDDTFEPLTNCIIHIVSLTAPLFELFNYGCCTITLQPVARPDNGTTPMYKAEVWEVLSRNYVRQRWAGNNKWIGRVEVVLQYGFHLYGEDIPTHYFTHPADNFHTEKGAYIHPVLHAFRHDGEDIKKDSDYAGQIEEWHMQESLFARWDEDDYNDEGTNVHQFTNTVYNAVAAVLDMPNRKSTLPMYDGFIDRAYPPLTADEVEQALQVYTLKSFTHTQQIQLVLPFFQREPGLRWLMKSKANLPTIDNTTTHQSSAKNENSSDGLVEEKK